MKTKPRILFDLKPALDNYAGIPQETRLLFAGLRSLQEKFEVDALVQHGGSSLSAASSSCDSGHPAERIINHSRSVISFYAGGKKNLFSLVRNELIKYTKIQKLRWRALNCHRHEIGTLDAHLFEDFIWRRLFSKTLKPAEKTLVTSARFRILKPSRRLMHQVGLQSFSYLTQPHFLTLETRGYDYFLAQTPFPGRVTPGTKLVIRYHDAVPVLMPHTIDDKIFHQASHFYALRDNVNSGSWFVCVSESTRQDLLKIFPEVESRTSVIHNMISDAFFVDESTRSQAIHILQNRVHRDHSVGLARSFLQIEDAPYLLMVSTIEPRKNHELSVAAWERLRYTDMPTLRLVVVGNPGWDYKPIQKIFLPWIEQGALIHLSDVPANELRALFKHATATICPSIAEGFDYSGIEAMACGGLVIASDIAVHREVFGNAAGYFDTYCPDDAAQKIRYLLSKNGETEANELRARGISLKNLFSRETLLQKWEALLKN